MGALESLLQTAQKIQADHERTVAQLIEAQKELARLKDDKLVTWEWVCQYLGVEKVTALKMLANEKVMAYGRNIKRFRRMDIVRFAERHMIKVQDLEAAIPSQTRRSQK